MRRLPVALAAGLWLALAPANALAADRFTDPLGDVDGGPAPDIVSVTVADEEGGSITFSVEFGEEPPLAWSEADGFTDMIMILLDTGEAPATIDDAEYVIGVHAVTIDHGEFRSLDQGSGEVPGATVDVTVDGRTVSLSVPLSAIGNPTRVQFWVGVGREAAQDGLGGGSDAFPASGMQRYAVGTSAGTPDVAPVLALAAAAALLTVLVMLRRTTRERAVPVAREGPDQGAAANESGPTGPGPAPRT